MAEDKTSDEPEDKTNYLDELDNLDDDFDVEVKIYRPPQYFRSFVMTPFHGVGIFETVMCKTGPIKLPKEIIELYQKQAQWNFENYHSMELMALIYLNYYKDCDEWRLKPKLLESEIQDICAALPHFKSISELFTYAVINGDMKQTDFDQVIESNSSNSYDVTGLNDE